MNALFQEFQKAASEAKNLAQKPTDQELLDVYANFKQVTTGDCNTGMFYYLTHKWQKIKPKNSSNSLS